jgi:hypothetical protein
MKALDHINNHLAKVKDMQLCGAKNILLSPHKLGVVNT